MCWKDGDCRARKAMHLGSIYLPGMQGNDPDTDYRM